MRVPNTLAFRLTLWYTVVFIASSAVLLGGLYFALSGVMESRMDEDLQEDIDEYHHVLTLRGMEVLQKELEREIAGGDERRVFLRLLDSEGLQNFATDLTHWPGVESDKDALANLHTGTPFVVRTSESSASGYPTREIYGRIGDDVILHIGESMEEKAELLETLRSISAVTLLFVLPLASIVGWMMSRKAVRGIDEVSRIAATIQRGQLDTRVAVNVQDREIQKLATTFNAMLDRIGELVSSMREMTDNIAHDLRSPLARIRVIAESVLTRNLSPEQGQAAAADTLEACDRLLQMINTTLDVAEVEAGAANLAKDDVNVTHLVTEACELFEPVAEQKNIQLSWRTDRNVMVRGNAQYLQRMLSNLVENALKYTPQRGRVNVTLMQKGDHVAIEISDTGVGIAAKDIPRLFERFFRCDGSRTEEGCGLGLSFSRAVVRAHGGEIKVASELNVGSTFSVHIPTAC